MAAIGEQLEEMALSEGEHLPEPSIYAMDDDESSSTTGASHDAPMCNTPTGCVHRRFSSLSRAVSTKPHPSPNYPTAINPSPYHASHRMRETSLFDTLV